MFNVVGKFLRVVFFSLLSHTVYAENQWEAGSIINTDGSRECRMINNTAGVLGSDVIVRHRMGDKNPTVQFAAYLYPSEKSARYIITTPKDKGTVREVLPNKDGRLVVTGRKAAELVDEMKRGHNMAYRIYSPEKEYPAKTISLMGFTKLYNALDGCSEVVCLLAKQLAISAVQHRQQGKARGQYLFSVKEHLKILGLEDVDWYYEYMKVISERIWSAPKSTFTPEFIGDMGESDCFFAISQP